MSSPEQALKTIHLRLKDEYLTFQFVIVPIFVTNHLCQFALGALYESFAFRLLGFFLCLFVCFFKLISFN